MPLSKTGWPSLNELIFPPIFKLVLDNLNCEEGHISAKTIAEQLGISRERVGSTIHEDLDMQKLISK